MSDAHKMIVDDISEVVCRISVGLDQDHIVKLGIVYSYIAVYLVMKSRGSGIRIVLSDNIRHSGIKICLYLLFCKRQAVLVINVYLLTADSLSQAFKALFRTEAVICFSFIDELLCIF